MWRKLRVQARHDLGSRGTAKKLRIQASEADHVRVSGRSNVRVLESGRRFVLYEENNPDRKYEEHAIIRAVHQTVDRSYETASTEPEYQNTFEALPARVPLTPHRTTRRPKIEGTQVAIVAGPPGEEIHPNAVGEMKLWFPWDRRAKKDGTDTTWVRVGQISPGGGWGGQIIPRIGMEVMVALRKRRTRGPQVSGKACEGKPGKMHATQTGKYEIH